jgi:hypothetical protein
MATWFNTDDGQAALKSLLGMDDVDETTLTQKEWVSRQLEMSRRYRELVASQAGPVVQQKYLRAVEHIKSMRDRDHAVPTPQDVYLDFLRISNDVDIALASDS